MKRLTLLIILATILTSCFDEDSYVINPVPIAEVKIPYDINDYQTYFSLNDTLIVSYNSAEGWDLGFESSASGYHIILNTSKFMLAGNTNSTDFYGITSSTSYNMIFDSSTGDLNSTAIGDWADFSDPLNPIFLKKVYVIDRGKNKAGVHLGFKKIVFEKFESNKYFIKYSNLDNSDEHVFEIPKDETKNFVQFSFNNGGNLTTQEPSKDNWDLLFTKYSTILFDNNNTPTPYPVRGLYINKGISVALDSVSSFSNINIEKANSYTYSSKQDAIGYSWKDYVKDVYIVLYHYNYIIKDKNNNFFKIRFTSYKNTDENDPNVGDFGYISFEMQKIEE